MNKRFRCIKECDFIARGQLSYEIPVKARHVLFEPCFDGEVSPWNKDRKNLDNNLQNPNNYGFVILPLCLIESCKEYFEEINA